MLQMPYKVLCYPLPLSLPHTFKEELTLRTIRFSRNTINVHGNPVPLHANPTLTVLKTEEVKVTAQFPYTNHHAAQHSQAVLLYPQPFATS